ncbi:DUF1428 domain-containing protein [Desertibaculum subflavum]|uniref:DUF1428 domain-containing protein n=1 Tax=Desertibaculum subflavum TaxID=2268458 RepID=UPI000E66CB0C
MTYIEGFVAAVPAANKETYLRHARDAAPIFKEFGVTRHVEAWGDDVPDGKQTDLKRAVQAKPDEVVVFAWFEYPSKQARDAANAKMRTDPRMERMGESMPFDGSRMIYGGFATLVDERSQGRAGYIDGVVIAAPAAAQDAYLGFAKTHAALFREHGALRVLDAWGDDVPDGKQTDFKRAVQATAEEKVVFGWVEWPSKPARDAAWAKLMSDPRMQGAKMPFDGSRMIFGGFAPILDS